MGKILAVLACFGFMAGAADAQDIQQMLKKLKGVKKLNVDVVLFAENEETPYGKLEFKLNEKGDVTQYTVDALGGYYTNDYSYEYDGQGRKTKMIQKFHEILRGKTVFKYNADGSFTETLVEYAGEKAGKEQESDITTTEYDTKGRVVSVLRFYKFLNARIHQVYRYNQKGYLEDMQEDSGGQVESLTTFKNDERGNILERLKLDLAAGKIAERTTSTWNDRNDALEICDYENEKLSKKQQLAYVYNDKGHPKELTIKMFGAGDEKPVMSIKAKMEYEYYK